MRRSLIGFWLACCLLAGTSLGAQQTATVTGRVLEAETGKPLAGTTIAVIGGASSTTSNDAGTYTIQVPSLQSRLRVSHVGFLPAEISIDGRQNVDIILTPSASSLEEVVIVGYGAQKKVTMTGAVSTIDAKKLENRPVANVVEALQGQVPGLTVVRTSAQPGNQQIDFRVRGTSTFSNNPVLTIIDGVPSSLDRINPADIESISVLKDAASAAIYGSRATGGVILVTTKSGRKGPPKITLNSSIGTQSATRFAEKVSALDHALLSNEARANDGGAPKFTQAQIDKFSSPDFKQVNWDDYMLRNAMQTDHNISISGGSDFNDYYVSFGYLKQDGVLMNTSYERFNIQVNQNLRITNKLKLGLKLGYIPSITTSPTGNQVSSMLTAVAALPNSDDELKTADGRWLARADFGTNPIAQASEDAGQTIQKGTRLSGNISLDYNILPQVKLTANYGMVRNASRLRDYAKILTLYQQANHDVVQSRTEFNSLRVGYAADIQHNANLLANYTQRFGDHNLSVLGGVSAEWYNQETDGITTRNFLTDDIYVVGAGTSDPTFWGISGTANDWSLASVVGRASYSFKERYLLEGSFRYDGSSRFMADQRWGFFPAVSAGWVISKENFMANIAPVNFLKLRASWGQVGNQNVGFYPFAATLSQTTYYFNGQPNRGVQTAGAPNPNLTWETKSSANIGLEARLFRNLLEVNLEVFRERTSDILMALPLPTTFGQGEPVQNAGVVDNKGWELELAHRNKIGQFTYGVSVQVSNVTNKVVSMGGVSPIINGNVITEEGYSINEWYGLRSIGMFQTQQEVTNAPFQTARTSPGDLRYQNNGGDPNLINSDDRVRLGASTPRFPYGIRINAGYKGIDLTIFGQGVGSQIVWSNGWTAQNFDRENSTLRVYHLDRWTPETPNARFPKTRMGSGAARDGINDRFSSFWLEDASYFRLKNIEIGYTLPSQLLDRFKIQRLRVFVNAENALTFTKYLGYDPETPSGTSARLLEGRYPLAKLYNVGLNINF
ncbi:MAG: TonB-dependent receptor [Chitinophagaceae bacterium]|nr:TonB-dependent receptor [Chitinophagaceae bacterium]